MTLQNNEAIKIGNKTVIVFVKAEFCESYAHHIKHLSDEHKARIAKLPEISLKDMAMLDGLEFGQYDIGDTISIANNDYIIGTKHDNRYKLISK